MHKPTNRLTKQTSSNTSIYKEWVFDVENIVPWAIISKLKWLYVKSVIPSFYKGVDLLKNGHRGGIYFSGKGKGTP